MWLLHKPLNPSALALYYVRQAKQLTAVSRIAKQVIASHIGLDPTQTQFMSFRSSEFLAEFLLLQLQHTFPYFPTQGKSASRGGCFKDKSRCVCEHVAMQKFHSLLG